MSGGPVGALRELIAVKQLRAEVLRRKQRRQCSILREPAEVRAVAKLHQECREREAKAWKAAQAAVSGTSDQGFEQPTAAVPVLLAALEAVLTDCRDVDTDSCISLATGRKVVEAIAIAKSLEGGGS